MATQEQVAYSDQLLPLRAENPKNVLTLLFDHCPRIDATVKTIPPPFAGQVLGKFYGEESRFHSTS
jgi:hypothetical protein